MRPGSHKTGPAQTATPVFSTLLTWPNSSTSWLPSHISRSRMWRPLLFCVHISGQEALGCEVNGVTYGEGQSFQPSCDTLCRCSGGGVACVPACPLDVRRPTPDCPRPQHIRLPGKCCKQWVCENLENTVIQDAITGGPCNPALPDCFYSCWQCPYSPLKGGGCIFTKFFLLDVVVTALFLVYMRFVIRGHVWNILQEHFYALDWGVSDQRNIHSLNITLF